MKPSGSGPRKSRDKFNDCISTENLLRSVAEEQKSMMEELDRTLQIMREMLASLDAAKVELLALREGRSCPPFKM